MWTSWTCGALGGTRSWLTWKNALVIFVVTRVRSKVETFTLDGWRQLWDESDLCKVVLNIWHSDAFPLAWVVDWSLSPSSHVSALDTNFIHGLWLCLWLCLLWVMVLLKIRIVVSGVACSLYGKRINGKISRTVYKLAKARKIVFDVCCSRAPLGFFCTRVHF